MTEENQDQSLDYSLSFFSRPRWVTISIAVLLLGIISYFPLMYKMNSFIKRQLQSLPGCALDYDEIKFEFFLPKVIVSDITVPQSCIGKFGEPLKMDALFVYFRGFSFSPLGPHFKIETNLNNMPLELYLTQGISATALNVRDNYIDTKKLNKIFPEFNLNGKVKIDALIKISDSEIKDLKINISSKDLLFPAQDILGFKLTSLKVNNLLIKGEVKQNKKLVIEDIILGDIDSPIRANFKGSLDLNAKNFLLSQMNLAGEVAFNNAFLEKYAIIKLFMAKFDKNDEYYQIKITGPLRQPNATSARK
jgi:hypothetical protein